MHYLVTGHTGFKGSWLSVLLASRGHEVSGISLDPVEGGIFETAEVSTVLTSDLRIDIRDADALTAGIGDVAPDVVVHLAAQPLVRESYRNPRETIETNVMGTMNVLEAVSAVSSVRACLIVTTDKVYRNDGRTEGYLESDPLGGHDPYSASKAMADLLSQSWSASFPGVPTAIARAGNVIGGGDVARDRLLPDLLRAFEEHRPASLRYPASVRPWQHVLDCANGYLALVDALLAGRGAGEWNFGPGRESFVPVSQVADLAASRWGGDASWRHEEGEHPHEAALLSLNADKAQRELGWSNRLRFPESLDWAVDWERRVVSGDSPRTVTDDQVAAFEEIE